MLRLLFTLVKITLLVAAFLLVRYYTGTTTLELLDVQIDLDTSVLFILLLFLLWLVYSFTSLWHRAKGMIERRRHRKSERNWQNVLSSLLKAEQSLLQGQNPEPYLEKSNKLGGQHLYVRYREAITCVENGNIQKAEQLFLPLCDHKETKLLALTQLATIAKNEKNIPLLWERAQEAVKLAPRSVHIHQLLLETCIAHPELTEHYTQNIQPMLTRHHINQQKEILPLYVEWLLQKSRQQEASSTAIADGHTTAIKFAKEAFTLSKDTPSAHALAFERLIHSLIVQEKEKDLRKADKLMRQYWYAFASLGHGRTYRDIILRGKTTPKKIQAIRALLAKNKDMDTSKRTTTQVLLAETLIDHGIWGEAQMILERLAQEQPHQHKEVRASLTEKVQSQRRIKGPSA